MLHVMIYVRPLLPKTLLDRDELWLQESPDGQLKVRVLVTGNYKYICRGIWNGRISIRKMSINGWS